MDKNLDRRDFAKRTSVAVGSLLTGALLGSGPAAGHTGDLSDKRLVLLGLNALARAHELDYFADGHRGASMVAAHLLCVDNDLDEHATPRIVELVNLNWASSPLCKYPYSYYDLLRRAGDPKLRRTFDAKAYHLF